jgi:hypothetical protein
MRRHLLILAAATALVGCGRDGDATGVSDDRFVSVVVELRRAANETRADHGAWEARKQQILREAGVTEEQLRAYVGEHSRDLRHMAGIWEAINEGLTRDSDGFDDLQ